MGFILALLLIIFPGQIRPFGPPVPVDEKIQNIQNIYHLVFIENELLDPREARYVFVKPEEFLVDIKMIQSRAERLKDVSFVDDSIRWPERDFVNKILILNREYRQWLENCIELYPENASLKEAREETEFLYKIWDAVRDARCEYYYVHIRREAMLKLKTELDKIDETWYDKGMLPPFVPVWRFTSIR